MNSVLSSLMGGGLYNGTPLSELPANMRTLQMTLGNTAAIGTAFDHANKENYDPSRPGAYLNYMLFDENGKMTSQYSSMQVDGPENQWNTLAAPSTIEVGKAGYLLAFTSSKSSSPVWFDQVKVTFYKGAVLEENDY